MPGFLLSPVESRAVAVEHPEPIPSQDEVLTALEAADVSSDSPVPGARAWTRWVEPVLLGLAAVFFLLHYVHLKADFPNFSAWKDWAKYTDEGWYGDAAIRHYKLGHWNVPGDFNPAAALPVWPALELILFRFTGVSLAAARALSVTIFGLIMVTTYGLLRLWRNPGLGSGRVWRGEAVPLAPATAAVLLGASPFCFVFTRLAILEPLLILLSLLALVAATYAGRAAASRAGVAGHPRWRQAIGWSVALGVLLPLAVLTKTTAVFLFPAIAWTLWAAGGSRLRPFLRTGLVAAAVGVVLWGAYYGLFVRPHFLVDYRYLFSANKYTAFEWNSLGGLLMDTLDDAAWISRPLFWLTLASLGWALLRIALVGPRRNPLVTTLVLWILGYGAFLAYHANLQPRYYLVLAPAMFALVALAFEAWLARAERWVHAPRALRRTAIVLATAAVAYTGVRGAQHMAEFLLHPQYTWLSAARQVATIVNREAKRAGHSRLVLSISGSEMSLMTGIPAICDDFGSAELADRVAAYRPGWFATWNDVEDDKMEALAPLYRLERVATIPAFDDADRNVLILYRLVPREKPDLSPGTGRTRHTRPLHGGLRTVVTSSAANED
jgi:4-amino-4-deoxy-L-arabinose transferase-like glycosyltransferase